MAGATLVGGAVGALNFAGASRRRASIAGLRIETPRALNLQRARQNGLRLHPSVAAAAGFLQRNSSFSRFMVRAMAEESSESSVTTTEDRASTPEDEEDQANIRDIFRVVELLKKKRDMTSNEVRLTIMIEDPREVERRRQLGIEDERGCSKEDMGLALQEVFDGGIPEDRLVLRELTKEMLNWPNLEDEIAGLNPLASPYAKVTPTGVDPKVAAGRANVDWDAAAEIQSGEDPKALSDMLPPAVGFSFLYLVSFIPVIIVVVVILILFFNSLQ